ncbi:traC domain protein [Klebsiella pneumoniae]
MSNNIIDAVTQAVNSLVSALKLPDESAKANDTALLNKSDFG